MTDPIADMIIRVKNGYMARKGQVSIPYSKMRVAIAQILLEHKYVEAVEVEQEGVKKQISMKLKYINKTPAITGVKRVSKPGRRFYSSVKDLPRSLGGYGLVIVSTNKGIMAETSARKMNVGGEILCAVW